MRYATDTCEFRGIYGSSVTETITAHELGGAVTGKRFECVYAPSAVPLRTEHRSFKSLKSYKNLHKIFGLRQQPNLFLLMAEPLRSKKRARVDKDHNKELDWMLIEEKVTFSKNSSEPDIPLPKFQAHAPERFSPGPIANLSNWASNVTKDFNYHYSQYHFLIRI